MYKEYLWKPAWTPSYYREYYEIVGDKYKCKLCDFTKFSKKSICFHITITHFVKIYYPVVPKYYAYHKSEKSIKALKNSNDLRRAWSIMDKLDKLTKSFVTEKSMKGKPKHFLNPQKDKESLFCDTNFLEELLGKKVKPCHRLN